MIGGSPYVGYGSHRLLAYLRRSLAARTQVAGFDWTPPRQVAFADLKRPPIPAGNNAGSGGGAGIGREQESGGGSGGGGANKHVPGIGLQTVPCRNMSNQIFYLSVEAASIRVRKIEGEKETQRERDREEEREREGSE